MSKIMNIFEIFENLRYHHENEVEEFKKAENNFDFKGKITNAAISSTRQSATYLYGRS
jgi:hypothetical protein